MYTMLKKRKARKNQELEQNHIVSTSESSYTVNKLSVSRTGRESDYAPIILGRRTKILGKNILNFYNRSALTSVAAAASAASWAAVAAAASVASDAEKAAGAAGAAVVAVRAERGSAAAAGAAELARTLTMSTAGSSPIPRRRAGQRSRHGETTLAAAPTSPPMLPEIAGASLPTICRPRPGFFSNYPRRHSLLWMSTPTMHSMLKPSSTPDVAEIVCPPDVAAVDDRPHAEAAAYHEAAHPASVVAEAAFADACGTRAAWASRYSLEGDMMHLPGICCDC
ncbi:hypothetical protein [Oryza sativa Japonica Group]|uniref:Uncharacterized protein n=1 Tax=Oryza sativa subsp. japonica TaxID=39947 RepID=Q5NBF2_ORYSJ|nr:hypothetical protein [Oryza sativa Japonica Group]